VEKVYKLLEYQLPPLCSCGGTLKPDTVFFGEPLPEKALSRALSAAKYYDMFIVIGSSLVISPASQLPVIAKENGAFLAIIKIDPTPLDEMADLVIHKKASEVLPIIVK
jgi:NAD-dependent deacetylase